MQYPLKAQLDFHIPFFFFFPIFAFFLTEETAINFGNKHLMPFPKFTELRANSLGESFVSMSFHFLFSPFFWEKFVLVIDIVHCESVKAKEIQATQYITKDLIFDGFVETYWFHNGIWYVYSAFHSFFDSRIKSCSRRIVTRAYLQLQIISHQRLEIMITRLAARRNANERKCGMARIEEIDGKS